MLLSIVIPSYNGLALLKKSLPRLYSSLDFAKVKKYEVIVVDNGTKDQTKKYLKKYQNIVHLYFSYPLGFVKAINTGIKKAEGKYILLLNNDCLLEKSTIKKLLDFLQKNENIYLAQPTIKESGRNTIGYKVKLKIAKAFPVGKNTPVKHFTDQPDPFNKGWLYGLSATCLMLKKEVFGKIGFFDESFHSYLEDIDFMFRAVKKNVKFTPCINAQATHLHMQTSQKMGTYKAKRDFLNWVRIIKKHYPKTYLAKHFPHLFIERLRNFSGCLRAAY